MKTLRSLFSSVLALLLFFSSSISVLATEEISSSEPELTSETSSEPISETDYPQETPFTSESTATPEETSVPSTPFPDEYPSGEFEDTLVESDLTTSSELSVNTDDGSSEMIEEEIEEENVIALSIDGAIPDNSFPFTDVSSSSWYYDSVSFAYFNQLMYGVNTSTFSPNASATRAMIVTVLWRMSGSPAPSASSTFTDLTQSWYKDAVSWAQEKGIASGVSEDRFAPNKPVTREQIAAFIARYAENICGINISNTVGSQVSYNNAYFGRYADVQNTASYALSPMAWAIKEEIISGYNVENTYLLYPKREATRAQIATILMNLRTNVTNVPSASESQNILVSKSLTAGKTNQIITVIDHSLTLWERGTNGIWSSVLTTYAGYGAKGMKTDRVEGDGTTPIGAFPLLYAFGRDSNPGSAMNYRQITNYSYFSSDGNNGTYNTWVESSNKVNGEHLIDYANLQYLYGMVIGYNVNPTVVGKGSAIFLHCKGNTWNTSGCVSIEKSLMLTLLKRVGTGAWIIIVPEKSQLINY